MNKALLLLAVFCLSGCSSIGIRSERMLQKKVPPPVVDEITEDIKQASDYIAHESTEQPVKDVAVDLSQRVGAPEHPLDNSAAVKAALAKGTAKFQAKFDKLNRHLKRYGGRDIEGTGISVWGAGIGALAIGLLVLCVFVPVIIPLVFKIVQILTGTTRRVLSQTVQSVTAGIEDWGRDNPDAYAELKDRLAKHTDRPHKDIINKAKVGALK